MGDGPHGPIPVSRLAGWPGQLPASQGYIGTGGDEFRPRPRFAVPGPTIGTIAPPDDAIGAQWAPGQGGDTPGGGGAALIGMTQAVETSWIVDGFVVPLRGAHQPGTVGFQGARRGRA
jgi:hypothetical protein